jgi:hypothetical protein
MTLFPNSQPVFDNLLLGAGAMKAGTTWLYKLLDCHPDIYFCEEKEIHYFAQVHGIQNPLLLDKRILQFQAFASALRADQFNSRLTKRKLRWFSAWLAEPLTDQWYRDLFFRLAPTQYAADFSNLTALIPLEGWSHIRSLTKRLRVIYIIRDPIERLWSHVKFHSQFTGKLDDFKKASPDQIIKMATKAHIWENGEYGKIIKRMKLALDPGELLILDFDELHADPSSWLRRIEEFLGLPAHIYETSFLDKRINASHSSKVPDYFVEEFREEMIRINGELEEALSTQKSSARLLCDQAS